MPLLCTLTKWTRPLGPEGKLTLAKPHPLSPFRPSCPQGCGKCVTDKHAFEAKLMTEGLLVITGRFPR